MDFEKAKKAYDSMNWQQQKQFAEQNKNNPEFQQFANQYLGGNKQTPPPTQPNPAPAENNQILFRWGNQEAQRLPWYRESMPKEPVIYWGDKQFDPNEQLDQSRFTNPNAQVQVQAGNAKQTWMPDYQDDSDARMNEITNNLNAYWNTNREYFSDRQTFNRNFKYEKRNESQKALLDSFRKRKELDQKVAGYTDWKSVSLALEEGVLTKAQLEALKVQNPKVYAEYLEDQLNKKNLDLVNTGSKSRIFNEDEQISHNTDALTDIMRKLGFDMSADGRAKELYEKFKELKADPKIDTMKQDYLEARKIYLQRRREFNTLPERIRAQSTGASETLISARISKAQRLAYNELQTLADEAQIRKEEYVLEYGEMKDEFNAFKMQADEDYRAFTSKMSSLWFAKGLLGFETPEQQRQGQLRQLEAQNQLTLQFEKDKIALQSELSDINSKDPKIQFNAVMKALDPHYKEFGSIILRPQAQAAQDIINLAKKEGISVGEAMRKNFTEPLQKKAEYRAMMNKKLWIDPTDGQNKREITQDEDWKIKIKMTGTGQIPENFNRQQRISSYGDWFQNATSLNDIGSIVADFQDWAKTGQCWAFANDIAKAMGSNLHFWSGLSEKTNPTGSYTKSDTPQVGSFAIFNSKKFPSNGHVGVVTKVNANGSFVMKSSNRNGDEKLYTSSHTAGSALTFIVPSVDFSQNVDYNADLEPYYNRFNDKSWKTKLTSADYKFILWYGIDQRQFAKQALAYKQAKDQEITPFAKELIGQLQELKRMDSWDFKNVWLWGIPWTKWAYYKSLYDRILSSTALHNLIDLKWQGATFWALSNQELEFITNASTNLKLKLGYGDFMDIVDQMIFKLNKGITTAWWNGGVDMNLSDQGGGNQTLFSDMMRK